MRITIVLSSTGLTMITMGCGPKPPTQAGGHPVSHWVHELKSSDAKVRRHAVTKLGNVGTSDPEALPAVRGALADADPGVRAEAGEALVEFRAAAKEAEGQLQGLPKKDRRPQIRENAAEALGHMRSAQ